MEKEKIKKALIELLSKQESTNPPKQVFLDEFAANAGRPKWGDGTPIGGPIREEEDWQAQEALVELGEDDLEEEEIG